MYKLFAVLLLSAFTTALAAPEAPQTTRRDTSKDVAPKQQSRAQTSEISPIVQALLGDKKHMTINKKVKK